MAGPFDDLPDAQPSANSVTPSENQGGVNIDALPEPLKPYAPAFEKAGNKYGIDPNFLAAIAWNETGGGTSRAFRQGNNAMGISNASGPIYGFNSVADSIDRQAATLARPTGPYKGASTIQEVGSIYSPVGAANDPYHLNADWTGSVGNFYNKLTGRGSNAPVLHTSSGANQPQDPFADLPNATSQSSTQGDPFADLPNAQAQPTPTPQTGGISFAPGTYNLPPTGGLNPQTTTQPTTPSYNPIENALRNFANTAATSTLNSIGGAVRYFGGAQQKDLQMAQNELAQAKASGASDDDLSEIQGRIDNLQSQLGSTKQAANSLAELSSEYPTAYGVNPQDKSVSAQIGRGLGGVTSMIPSMATGPAGMALGALQGASQAYEDTYQNTVQDLQNKGFTDQSVIDDQAQKAATQAAVKTAPSLAAYLVGGKLASAGVSKLLSTQTPLIQGVAGAIAGSVANTAAGSTIRKMMGESVMPTPESLTQDIAFGLFHGVTTGVEAQEKLRQQIEAEKAVGGPAPKVAPSANPVVNDKEAAINASADAQFAPQTPAVETPAPTPAAAEAPVTPAQAKIDDLFNQQWNHEEGSPEWNAIQAQIDALQKPAEAPVAEAPTEEPTNAVQEQGAREVGVRNAPAVGEGVGEQNKPEEVTQEGEKPQEKVAPSDQIRYQNKSNEDIAKEIEDTKQRISELEQSISSLQKKKFVPQEEKIRASRGKENLLKRISAEEAFAKISTHEAGAMRDFVNMLHDDYLSDVALSIREKSKIGGQGFYDFGNGIVTLVRNEIEKGQYGFDKTFLHELWHSLSRFISPEDLAKVSKQYLKEQSVYVEKNPWFKALIGKDKLTEDQYNDWRKFVDQETADKNTRLIVDNNGKPILEKGKKQYEIKFNNENYRFKDIDEWFAETMSDKSMDKYYDMEPAVRNIMGFAKKIYTSILETIKNVFSANIANKIYNKLTSGELPEKQRTTALGYGGSENESVRFSKKQAEEQETEKYAPKPPTEQETFAKKVYDTSVKQRGKPPTPEEMQSILSRKFPGITSRNASDLYDTASGKPKPPTPYAGGAETTAETPEKISIRTKDQEDQVRRGILTSVVPAGEGMSLTEIEERGQQNLANGADPYSALDKAKSGDLESLFTAKAYYKALQKQKSEILKTKGPNSPEYKSISQKAQDYYERLREAGTTASTALSVFRGETDLSDAADIATEFTKDTGEEPTLSQHQKIAELSDNVDKTTKQADVATTQAKDALDEALSDVEVKTPESVEEGRQQIGDLSDAQGVKQKAEIDRLNSELEQTRKDLEEIKQSKGQSADELKAYYEAKIKDLESQQSPKYGKEVFEQAKKIVDRWKAEAVEAEKELSKKLAQLGSSPDPTIVVPLAKMIRAWIGEFGVTKAEALTRAIERFGEKIRPHFEAAWKKAEQLIKGEPGAEKTTKTATEAKKPKAKAESKMSPEEKKANNLRKRIEQAQKKIDDINSGKVSTPKEIDDVTNEEIQRLEKEYEQKKQELADARMKAKQADLFAKDKIGEKLNPEQVKTLWESAKKFYIDKGENDWDKMVNDLSSDFGLTPKQVREGLASPKGAKKATDEMYRAQINRRAALNKARRWLDNEKAGVIGKLYGAIAERTFRLSILGHGTAFMGTHAPSVRYSHPILSAKNWLKGFAYSFKGKDGRIKNFQDNKDLIYRPTWRVAREAGLENNPFAHDNEAPVKENSQNIFGRALDTITGGRGFDALYHLRQDMFDKKWADLSITQRTPEYAKILAERINNATGYNKGGRIMGGIVQSPLARAMLFAPKLVYSRFQWLFADPAKMLGTFAKMATGQKTTMAERMGASYEFWNKAKFLAGLTFALGVNQALLKLSGSNQSINFTDPKKYDWLAYKGYGYQLQTVGAMTRLARLLFQEIHDAFGNLTNFEKSKGDRMTLAADDFVRYLKSGLSPLTRDIAVAVTGKDYVGNTVPWSKEQPDRGRKQLTWGEILAQQFTPIPISEASTQKELLPAVIKSGTAILRGDRIETPQDLEEYKKSMQSRGRTRRSSSQNILGGGGRSSRSTDLLQ